MLGRNPHAMRRRDESPFIYFNVIGWIAFSPVSYG